jgi:hypothetical protein
MKKYLQLVTTFIPIIISIIFVGCGTSNVTISPNYESELFKIENKPELSAEVIKVKDNRKEPLGNTNIGIAQVGLFNKKVPYNIDEPVSEFVKKSITKMLSEQKDSLFLPINIIINKFLIYEETGAFSESGNFESELVFIYPVSKDSFITINTFCSEQSSGLDVTDGLENLIYKGITTCTNKFLSGYTNNKSSYFVGNESESIFKTNPDTLLTLDSMDSNIVNQKKHNSDSNIGVSYCSGENVKYGFQLLYQNYDSLNSNLGGGFGYTFLYYQVENKTNYLEGSFVSFNYRFSLRYFVNHTKSGFYLMGGLKLSFGTENIDYGIEKQTSFFIGPTLEEAIGISINNRAMLEFGSYQLKFFGSDLLPYDIGFSVGLYFRI